MFEKLIIFLKHTEYKVKSALANVKVGNLKYFLTWFGVHSPRGGFIACETF